MNGDMADDVSGGMVDMTWAVRGAICLDADTKEEMQRAVERLVPAVLEMNGVAPQGIVSILFSQTADLQAANPATCLRRLGFAATPLFCTQEPRVVGAAERLLRVLITFRAQRVSPPQPLYLNGASRLRPDL